MYRHVLIATDGSRPSTKAVNHGVKLAKAVGARVTFVNVTEMWSAIAMSAGLEAGVRDPFADYERAVAQSARKVLAAAERIAGRAGIKCKTEHVPDRRPADGIVDAARRRKCDLIIVGSHGRRGIDRLLLGSQAYEVLTQSKVPVLVVR